MGSDVVGSEHLLLGVLRSGGHQAARVLNDLGVTLDDARAASQPTPQGFQFGVCAAASADPHCTVDPATVPKAVDVVTPAGTAQSDEIDYTVHKPVTIAPVVVP